MERGIELGDVAGVAPSGRCGDLLPSGLLGRRSQLQHADPMPGATKPNRDYLLFGKTYALNLPRLMVRDGVSDEWDRV